MNFPPIVVYCIVKNEQGNLKDFISQFDDVSRIVFLDTGSEDNTLSELSWIAKDDKRVQVSQSIIDPFDFSIARNICLKAATQKAEAGSLFMWLDIDERLEEGWYNKLVSYFTDFNVNLDKPSFFNTTMLFDVTDNSVNMSYHQRKLHTATGFVWKHSCHEILEELETVIGHNLDITVTHSPSDKPRNYLPLLENDLLKYPTSMRSIYYLGREHYYNKSYEKAVEVLSTLETATQEVTVAQHVEALLLRGDCYRMLKLAEREEQDMMRILSLSPNQKEACLRLAYSAYSANNTVSVLHWALKGMLDKGKNVIYNKSQQLEWQLYDLAAISYDILGVPKQALVCYVTILQSYDKHLDADTKLRIQKNVQYLIGLGTTLE